VLDQRTKHATVYFTDVGGAEYVHVLRCESKIEHPSLAAQISEVVGRPADEIKMIDGGNSRELYGELDLIARLRVVATEKGGKKHMVPIFTFVGDRDNGGPYLFDMPVQISNMQPPPYPWIGHTLHQCSTMFETTGLCRCTRTSQSWS
jgi:hypothetical protein